ncbi:MAG: DUF2958 domain-containing protein [Bacteroidales bacterium]
MGLLTHELENRFKEVGSQENTPDPLVIAKFFNPSGSGTWYATEYENGICFGYVQLVENEFGYFSMAELESVKCPPFNLPIERDLYFGEKPLSEACPELKPTIERRKELLKMQHQKDELREMNTAKENNGKDEFER